MPARPLKTLLLSSAVALGVCATPAGAATTTVVKVLDGDTVKVREGAKRRSVDLLGVEVPACHAAAATSELRKLLPAKARVRLVKDGARKGRYVHRGATLVNAALLRAGAARGKDLQALRQRSALTAAEAEAKTAKRGLWTACAAPASPGPAGGPTPADAITQARKDLAGRVFTRITATTFSSTESRLNLCSDGSFVEDVSTFSEFGDPSENPLPGSDATHQRYQGRWEVVSALYSADHASARVRRINQDGSEGFVDFVAQGGRVTANGFSVSAATSSVCT